METNLSIKPKIRLHKKQNNKLIFLCRRDETGEKKLTQWNLYGWSLSLEFIGIHLSEDMIDDSVGTNLFVILLGGN